jgi:hypothetical protein
MAVFIETAANKAPGQVCTNASNSDRQVRACFGAPEALRSPGGAQLIIGPTVAMTDNSTTSEDFNSGDFSLIQNDGTMVGAVNPATVAGCSGWGPLMLAPGRTYSTQRTVCFSTTDSATSGLGISWKPFYDVDATTVNLPDATTRTAHTPSDSATP